MKEKKPNLLVQIFSYLCIILGSLALGIFYLASWANSLIFDTNYYLRTVTPLPKNETVAKALSTYTIDTLFTEVNVEERIRNALPQQASFLVSPLTEQLEDRSLKRTTQIIQSDQFSSVWVAANTFFHQRILEIIRGGGILSQVQQKLASQERNVQFDASQLAQTIRDRLGSENQLFTNAQLDKFQSIAVPTFTNLENIRQIVYWISQITVMLLPASLALLLLGTAIAFSRPKAFLTTGITLIIVMVSTILTLLIIKTEFLNQITQSMYQDAARVVLNHFLRGLMTTLWLTILGGIIIIGLALSSGSHLRAANFRTTLGIAQLQKSKFSRDVMNIRVIIARYKLWFILFGILIALIVLFSMQNITFATAVAVISYLILYIALLLLIFPRQTTGQRR